MSNKHLNGYIDEDDRDIETDAAPVHYPTCRFCGKQTIPVAHYESDEIADEAATMKCDCYDAQMYRQDKQKKRTPRKEHRKVASKHQQYIGLLRRAQHQTHTRIMRNRHGGGHCRY